MTDTKAAKRVTTKLRALASAQERLNQAEDKAATLAAERADALLAASEAGASRANLEEATGLSPARITQVLRQAKTRRTQRDTI